MNSQQIVQSYYFSRNFLYVGLFLIVSGLCLGDKHEYSNQRRNGVTSFSYSSDRVNIHKVIHVMIYSNQLKIIYQMTCY